MKHSNLQIISSMYMEDNIPQTVSPSFPRLSLPCSLPPPSVCPSLGPSVYPFLSPSLFPNAARDRIPALGHADHVIHHWAHSHPSESVLYVQNLTVTVMIASVWMSCLYSLPIFKISPVSDFLGNWSKCIPLSTYPVWKSLTPWHPSTGGFLHLWGSLNYHLVKQDRVSQFCSSNPRWGRRTCYICTLRPTPLMLRSVT